MNTMNTFITRLKRFGKDESGATAIEYGLFAALIGAVIVGTVATLGSNTEAGFGKVNSAMEEAVAESNG